MKGLVQKLILWRVEQVHILLVISAYCGRNPHPETTSFNQDTMSCHDFWALCLWTA